MSKRITIMLDEEIDKKLRQRQAKIIRDTAGTCSFSKVLNEILLKGLK